jgi:hypothetical protein
MHTLGRPPSVCYGITMMPKGLVNGLVAKGLVAKGLVAKGLVAKGLMVTSSVGYRPLGRQPV